MVENHQINATDDPNNPKMKQNLTRFRTYCKNSGHTVKFCWSMRKKRLLNQKKFILKIIQTDQNRQIITDRTPTIALTLEGIIATAHTSQTAIVAEVTVTLELFTLKQDLTINSLYDALQSCNSLN